MKLSKLRRQRRRKTQRAIRALKTKQKGGAYGVEVPKNALKVNPQGVLESKILD